MGLVDPDNDAMTDFKTLSGELTQSCTCRDNEPWLERYRRRSKHGRPWSEISLLGPPRGSRFLDPASSLDSATNSPGAIPERATSRMSGRSFLANDAGLFLRNESHAGIVEA